MSASSGTPPAPVGGLISSDPERSILIDEDGRERIFHGTNIVYKGHPYAPPKVPIDTEMSFGAEDMDQLASWGFNSIRLGITWAGAEPLKGQYNHTYLSRLHEIVDELGQRGIYSYVELHQDALAERFCGNGLPNWAIDASTAQSFPQPLLGITKYLVNNSDGLPSVADCNRVLWADYYSTKAVAKSFQRIYDNTDGIGDRVVLLWQEVAKVFKDSRWLLGYELMNEPWPGDQWANPTLVYPGVADKANLAPFYRKISAAILEIDPDHLIMYEPIPWNNGFKAGFEESPCGEKGANKSVFAYHFYDPPDLMSPASYMGTRTADAKRLRSASFLTEFAASWNVPDKTAPRHDPAHIKDIVAAAERYKQSWSGWEYKVFHPQTGRHPMTPGDMSMFFPNGSLDMGLVSVLSRPYARATAGSIYFNEFTAESRSMFPWRKSSYVLKYNVDKRCRLPTEVYVNEAMHFSRGFKITAEPSTFVKATYNSKTRLVLVTHSPDIVDDELVTLEITGHSDSSEHLVV